MTVVKAADGDGETYMPVIVDMANRHALVLGPAGTPSYDGPYTTYVSKEDPHARFEVNSFLSRSVGRRMRSGTMAEREELRDLTETLIKAFSLVADFFTSTPSGVLPAGTTVGEVAVQIAKGKVPVCLWSAAVKKPPIPR